jgi:hypothetical protein
MSTIYYPHQDKNENSGNTLITTKNGLINTEKTITINVKEYVSPESQLNNTLVFSSNLKSNSNDLFLPSKTMFTNDVRGQHQGLIITNIGTEINDKLYDTNSSQTIHVIPYYYLGNFDPNFDKTSSSSLYLYSAKTKSFEMLKPHEDHNLDLISHANVDNTSNKNNFKTYALVNFNTSNAKYGDLNQYLIENITTLTNFKNQDINICAVGSMQPVSDSNLFYKSDILQKKLINTNPAIRFRDNNKPGTNDNVYVSGCDDIQSRFVAALHSKVNIFICSKENELELSNFVNKSTIFGTTISQYLKQNNIKIIFVKNIKELNQNLDSVLKTYAQ